MRARNGGVCSPEAGGGSGAGFGGFGFAVAMRGGGFEGSEKAGGNAGDLVNGGVEGGFVGFGWMVHASDFADELKGSGADFFGSDRGIKIEERFDVAAHGAPFACLVLGFQFFVISAQYNHTRPLMAMRHPE